MGEDSTEHTRRKVLKGIGAGIVPISGINTRSGRGPPPEAGEFIVGAQTEVAKGRARRRAKKVKRIIDFRRPNRRHAVVGVFSARAVEDLRQRSDVAYVEPNGTYEAFAQTLPWGVDRIDADIAHENGKTGAGASIAIIDTGIDSNHPDLSVVDGAAFGTKCRGGRGTCRKVWDDDSGHGTHCAGIADALNNTGGVVGSSTRAPLYAVKVLDKSGSGTWGAIADGINWTANKGIKVGSLSLGGGHSNTVKWACDDAYNRGVLLVAAAGNDGGSVSYPAKYESVMAVSATDRSDALASWSNRGPEIELAAPGVNIYSTLPDGYGTKSGTSMACPHVSGAAAQALAHVSTVTNNVESRLHLRTTAEDLGSSGPDTKFGYGLVDVANALGLDSTENIGG